MKKILEEQYIESKAATRLYIEAEKDALKLKFAKRLTRLLTSSITWLLSLGFIVLCITMLLFAMGFALGEHFGSYGLGFLCSAGAAIVLTIIAITVLKKIIQKPVLKITIKELFDE